MHFNVKVYTTMPEGWHITMCQEREDAQVPERDGHYNRGRREGGRNRLRFGGGISMRTDITMCGGIAMTHPLGGAH
jgi:hypothetical protein